MSASLSARLYVLAAALLFSTGGAAIKLSTLTNWQIAGFRSGVAAIVLWSALPTWRRIDSGAFRVGLAYAGSMVLYVTANRLTTAANAIFLQTTAPIYVLLLAPLLLGEENRWSDFVVVALMAAGLSLFFVASEPAVATAPDPARGNVVAAASGVTWALTLLGLRWLVRRGAPPGADPSGAAVIAGSVTTFLICLPLCFPVQSTSPARDVAVIAYLGIFQIGLAYYCLVRGVRGVRAVTVALLLVLEPILNAVLAWLIHHESPSPLAAVGSGLILCGLLAQSLLGSNKES